MADRARLVVIEGPDGVGGSVHAEMLAAGLSAHGIAARSTEEPQRGDGVGRHARAAMADPRCSWQTCALMAAADRAEHCDRSIAPLLREGTTVVVRRWWHSNAVYSLARAEVSNGVSWLAADREWLRHLEAGALTPDVTVLLWAPEAVLDERIARRRQASAYDVSPIRRRVRALYRGLADLFQEERFLPVNTDRRVEVVAAEVFDAVMGVCGG